MLHFEAVFPDVARTETRMLHNLGSDPKLPRGALLFRELYCTELGCDCRRVLIDVHHIDEHDQPVGTAATINHAFEPPADDDPEPYQTFLDPLNPQGDYAQQVIRAFEALVLTPAYQERLERHYAMFKAALADPRHRIHEVIASATPPDEYTTETFIGASLRDLELNLGRGRSLARKDTQRRRKPTKPKKKR